MILLLFFIIFDILCLTTILLIFDLYKRIKKAKKEHCKNLSAYYINIAAKEAEDRKELERKF